MNKLRFILLPAAALLVFTFFHGKSAKQPAIDREPVPGKSVAADASPGLRETASPPKSGDDALIAKALGAAPDKSTTATVVQKAAFAALQRKLAQSPEERIFEAAVKDPANYRARLGDDDTARAHNPAHAFEADFEADGAVAIRPKGEAGWTWRMKALDLPEAGPLSVEDARIERQRGPLITEWYVNEERGLEQFFTLAEPIAGDGEESRIRVAVKTGLEATQESHGHLVFRDTEGNDALHYHGLAVFDVDKNPLPARMELESSRSGETVIALIFDTSGAQFPVTVDPFVSTVLHRWEQNEGSGPGDFTVVDGSTFVFAAQAGRHGRELWKSDGTAAGTMMIKDIRPGTSSSTPRNLTAAGSMVFFSANDGTTGRELWKSDLSEGGTQRVADLNPGFSDGVPTLTGPYSILNNRIILKANDGTDGEELWSSDGSEGGTVQLKDINPGSESSNPKEFTKLNGELFFQAEDDTNGIELWKTDGTSGGTVLVADIYAGSSNSSPTSLFAANGVLFFSARDEDGTELWKSNGIVTEQVRDIQSGPSNSGPSNFVVFDGALFFRAYDDTNGSGLWKTDGSELGTELVKGLGEEGSISSLTPAGGTLFFRAEDATHGAELWKSDGTESGTVMVADIHPGPEGSNLYSFFAWGSTLYFTADDGATGFELWKSDGSAAGTMRVKDIDTRTEADGDPFHAYPNEYFLFDGSLYFEAGDASGYELWKTDGTEVGTVRVRDLNRTGSITEGPVKSGNSIFFAVGFDDLWASDGTAEGTRPLVPPGGTGDLSPEELTDVNGTLFFRGRDSNHGAELWKSNGTSAGTVRVRDIRNGTADSRPQELIPVGDQLFFSAHDGIHGRELWKSDGTAAGTVLVKDINPDIFESYPKELANLDGTVLFRANDGTNGEELWKSDGTEGGTVLVKDIVSGSSGSEIEHAAVVAELGLYFFAADDGVNGQELWKSDGTELGTMMVKDIEPGPGSSDPAQLTEAGRVLYFEAFTTAEGRELWISDGTDSGEDVGTEIVEDIAPGPADAAISQLTVFTRPLIRGGSMEPRPPGGGPTITVLAFLADDGVNGLELWQTASGDPGIPTGMLVDLSPGAPSGFTSDASIAYSEQLYFAGNDGTGTVGTELYSPPSIGAPGVPILHEDLAPGAEGSYPTGLIDLNGQFLWFAADGEDGYTLRSEPGDTTPDLTVGKNPAVQKGDNVYNASGAGQKQTLVSKKFKKLKFHGRMENDGDIAAWMTATGTRKNKNFRINYFGPTGNVTGQVSGAGYGITLPPGDTKSYRIEVKPKRKLKNKKTGKIKRKNKTITLKLSSSLTAQIDGIKAKAKAR